MNIRIVDPRTIWAVVAMEAALVLPMMSRPTEGDRFMGLAGPMLLLLLLPLGYLGVYQVRQLRDPSWRLLAGIGLALLTRLLVVSAVPDASWSGVLVWFGRSVVPAAIGIGLWWRGGALAVAEISPAEVRTEFSVLGLCLLLSLALLRPFLLPDPLLLGAAVGLFVTGGLIAVALSRQDAAQVAVPRFGGTLAALSGLVPAGVAVLVVGGLRPELLTTMWLLLARAIELVLTPIGLLLAWLSSLFPHVQAGAQQPPPRPVPQPPPLDPAALADAQGRLAWLGTLIVMVLLLAAAFAAILVARLLLQNYIRDPQRRVTRRESDELVVESSGTPHADAADVLGWLMRWLRRRFAARRRSYSARPSEAAVSFDAWLAYQRLLSWAEHQGLGRRPSETMEQLSARLARHVPEAADAVQVVTQTYEWERYGAMHPPADRLRRVREALSAFSDG